MNCELGPARVQRHDKHGETTFSS